MGNLTYTQIFTAVKLYTGNRSDVDTPIDAAIQAAIQDICTTFFHHELCALSTGTLTVSAARYILPTDLRSILDIKNTTKGNKLERSDWRTFDQQTAQAVDYPTQYDRFGPYIEVNPLPATADTIQLRYYKFHPVISGSQTTLIDPMWDEAIKVGAGFRIMSDINEHEKSQKLKDDYVDIIKTRTSNVATEDEDTDMPLGLRVK